MTRAISPWSLVRARSGSSLGRPSTTSFQSLAILISTSLLVARAGRLGSERAPAPAGGLRSGYEHLRFADRPPGPGGHEEVAAVIRPHQLRGLARVERRAAERHVVGRAVHVDGVLAGERRERPGKCAHLVLVRSVVSPPGPGVDP